MPPKRTAAAKKPAAKAAAAPMEDPKAPVPADADKKKRNLMTETLGISISNARCQSHMKASLISPEIEAQLTEKRAALKAAKEAAKAEGRAFDDDDDIASLKADIDEITEQVVRIGGDAPIAMAALADWVAKSCLRRAMDQTIAANHKMVEIAALHAGDLSTLDVYALIQDLPAIVTYDPENERTLREERAAANKAQKAAREAAKLAKEAGEPAAAKAEKEVAEDEEDEDAHGPSTTFHTYVDNATKKVKEDETYAAMRVSQRLREVVSDIVAEFVSRFSKVAKVSVLELLGVRTLNAGHLQALAKSIFVLKTGDEEDENMKAVLDYVAAKLKLYHDHLEAEKSRKWEEMDPTKKAELEAKKAAAADAKKKRDAENAKTKAIEMAKRAKELAAQVSQ